MDVGLGDANSVVMELALEWRNECVRTRSEICSGTMPMECDDVNKMSPK